MNAIFKTKERLLITGSDNDEKLIIKEFIKEAEDKDIKVSALVDINGDETGLAIELIEKTDASELTPSK